MDLHHLLLAGLPAHSGLPRGTDIVRTVRLVRFVPKADQSATAHLSALLPAKQTSSGAASTSALGQFCCRSRLKASANNDSLTLTRSAVGTGHDGSVGAGSR